MRNAFYIVSRLLMVVDETWNRMLQYNGVQSRRWPKKEIRNEVIGKKGKMLRKVPDWSAGWELGGKD